MCRNYISCESQCFLRKSVDSGEEWKLAKSVKLIALLACSELQITSSKWSMINIVPTSFRVITYNVLISVNLGLAAMLETFQVLVAKGSHDS